MDIHFYFYITIAAFFVFMGLPLFLMKPWQRKRMMHKLVDYQELMDIFSKTGLKENSYYQRIKSLYNAKSFDRQNIGKQNFFELKFRSFRDSLNFKKAALMAGLCVESQITIISDKQEFLVIFITSSC